MTDGMNEAERAPRERRSKIRELQARGFLRCETYLGNLARMNDLPVEEGPNDTSSDDLVDWVPAWLEWHMYRFRQSTLAHVTQRERLEQAKALMNDKQEQLLLLCEVELTGCTINDPEADVSTHNAIELLKKELEQCPDGSPSSSPSTASSQGSSSA